eukprot:GDKJ01003683.1.p1 GENE.GDKJ01003683.1~~GDKJ01003683.1.p1  ORF type:complete len:964 (-),score=170.81 GDKJ01003683.1:116-3007(-)
MHVDEEDNIEILLQENVQHVGEIYDWELNFIVNHFKLGWGVKIISNIDASDHQSSEDSPTELECVRLLSSRKKAIAQRDGESYVSRFISIDAPTLSPLIHFYDEKKIKATPYIPSYIVRLDIDLNYTKTCGGVGFEFLSKIHHPVLKKHFKTPITENLRILDVIDGIRKALLCPSWRIPFSLLHIRSANRQGWRAHSNTKEARASVHHEETLDYGKFTSRRGLKKRRLEFSVRRCGVVRDLPLDLSEGKNEEFSIRRHIENAIKSDSLGNCFFLTPKEFERVRFERERIWAVDKSNLSSHIPETTKRRAETIHSEVDFRKISSASVIQKNSFYNSSEHESYLNLDESQIILNGQLEEESEITNKEKLSNKISNVSSVSQEAKPGVSEIHQPLFLSETSHFSKENFMIRKRFPKTVLKGSASKTTSNCPTPPRNVSQTDILKRIAAGENPCASILSDASSTYANLNSNLHNNLALKSFSNNHHTNIKPPFVVKPPIVSPSFKRRMFHDEEHHLSPRFLKVLSKNVENQNQEKINKLFPKSPICNKRLQVENADEVYDPYSDEKYVFAAFQDKEVDIFDRSKNRVSLFLDELLGENDKDKPLKYVKDNSDSILSPKSRLNGDENDHLSEKRQVAVTCIRRLVESVIDFFNKKENEESAEDSENEHITLCAIVKKRINNVSTLFIPPNIFLENEKEFRTIGGEISVNCLLDLIEKIFISKNVRVTVPEVFSTRMGIFFNFKRLSFDNIRSNMNGLAYESYLSANTLIQSCYELYLIYCGRNPKIPSGRPKSLWDNTQKSIIESIDNEAHEELLNRALEERQRLHETVFGGGKTKMSKTAISEGSSIEILNFEGIEVTRKKFSCPVLTLEGLDNHPVVGLTNAICEQSFISKIFKTKSKKNEVTVDFNGNNKTKVQINEIPITAKFYDKPRATINQNSTIPSSTRHRLQDIYKGIRYSRSFLIDPQT